MVRSLIRRSATFGAVLSALVLLHVSCLRLPYFWDEAGYYIPAALDFSRSWLLIPESTLPTGHTPLLMIYLGLLWRVFGFSPLVTRVAMVLVAAGTVVATYSLARRVTRREPAAWSAALLAISPMFFAQSSLVYLDLAAGLFTVLAVLALLGRRMAIFALAASLAVLTKETAVVLLPVAWVWAWWQGSGGATHFGVRRLGAAFPEPEQALAEKAEAELPHSTGPEQAPALCWIAMFFPLVPLAAWTLYYHHRTGYWTGNTEYLQYNLFSTLGPGRIFWSLMRRLYEVFVGGFNWLMVLGAGVGIWWQHSRKAGHRGTETRRFDKGKPEESETQSKQTGSRVEWKAKSLRDFIFLAIGLGAACILMLSVVGGAILPRYLLPIFPLFFVTAVVLIWRLPKTAARTVCGVAAGCFVAASFINPPYPFPYEDNLSYTDFIRLHQSAARFLENQPGEPRILTAWPASDELKRPFLGYVREPMSVVRIEGFTPDDFRRVAPDSFELLYLYSRKWEPPDNLLKRFPAFLAIQKRYFDYAPQADEADLKRRFGLTLLQQFERRGQWVRIYERQATREAGRETK
ncbi:MAG TPA: glycosyltransferase family 39 protein [Terriglobia bacterium]|nr:glycosyltransferase family 39 protein [Terriglobia bacterium]